MSAFDPEKLLQALANRRVAYVLIGAVAARLQGFPRLTADADITPAPDRDNLERLARALRDLKAKVYTESVPEGLAFSCDAETLAKSKLWNLVTDAGRLDLVFEPKGTGGYDELSTDAIIYEAFGVKLHVARLEDILRAKRASARPQDLQDAIVIEAMLKKPRR
jgi:hypothetical protein